LFYCAAQQRGELSSFFFCSAAQQRNELPWFFFCRVIWGFFFFFCNAALQLSPGNMDQQPARKF
jgi:hypothetical protein